MKKFSVVFMLLFLASCSNANGMSTLEHPSPDQDLLQQDAGLSLWLAKDSYKESPNQIEIILKNESQNDVIYGEYYYLEMKKQGKWYALKHSDAVFLDNPKMKDFGKQLKIGEQTEQQFSIGLLGVELGHGEYRLVKTFMLAEDPGIEISLAAHFKVESH